MNPLQNIAAQSRNVSAQPRSSNLSMGHLYFDGENHPIQGYLDQVSSWFLRAQQKSATTHTITTMYRHDHNKSTTQRNARRLPFSSVCLCAQKETAPISASPLLKISATGLHCIVCPRPQKQMVQYSVSSPQCQVFLFTFKTYP